MLGPRRWRGEAGVHSARRHGECRFAHTSRTRDLETDLLESEAVLASARAGRVGTRTVGSAYGWPGSRSDVGQLDQPVHCRRGAPPPDECVRSHGNGPSASECEKSRGTEARRAAMPRAIRLKLKLPAMDGLAILYAPRQKLGPHRHSAYRVRCTGHLRRAPQASPKRGPDHGGDRVPNRGDHQSRRTGPGADHAGAATET